MLMAKKHLWRERSKSKVAAHLKIRTRTTSSLGTEPTKKRQAQRETRRVSTQRFFDLKHHYSNNDRSELIRIRPMTHMIYKKREIL